MFHHGGSLWGSVLESKHLGWQDLNEEEKSNESICLTKKNESIWWEDLRLVCDSEVKGWVNSMMEWKIRDEKHSRFWEDKWVGRIVCKIPLQDYTLYQSKNGRVFIKWEE